MTSPLMNEELLISYLQQPLSLQSAPRLKALSKLIILAAYDRKVTREFMDKTADAALGLIKIADRIESVAITAVALKSEQLTMDMVSDAAEQALKLGDNIRGRAARLMAEVAECPCDEDTQH